MTGLSIGAAARECGVEASALRYYEHAGLIPPVARDSAGRRVFGDEDIAWARYAVCLRSLGMGVREVARYVAVAQRADGEGEQMSLLRGHLERMVAQRAELDHFIAVAQAKLAAGRPKT